MRIKIIFEHLPKQSLPVNYQYLISSWIYKTMKDSNSQFTKWLHEKGYMAKGHKYKLFTYSDLQPKWYDLDKQNNIFTLTKSPTVLEVSLMVEDGVQYFIQGLFKNQMMQLKTKKHSALFQSVHIETLTPPKFSNNMSFKLVKPLFLNVGVPNSKKSKHLGPKEEGYALAFSKNIVNKANAFIGEEKYSPSDVKWSMLGKYSKEKLYQRRNSAAKGFLYDFNIQAPSELIRIGYFGGFGGQCSGYGMGMVNVLKS